MHRRGWLARWFSLTTPRVFLRNTAIASGVLMGVVLIVSVVTSATMRTQTPAAIGWVVLSAYIGVPLLWFLYVAVVVISIATHRPAPQPLRERNLLFAASVLPIRIAWSAAIIVLGGFVAGVVAQQLDSITSRYTAAGPQLSTSAAPSNSTIDALVGFSDSAYGWVVVIAFFTEFVVLYFVPAWIAGNLLLARSSGRLMAVNEWMKSKPAGEVEKMTTKETWAAHLSSPIYPLSFIVAIGFVGFLLFLLIGEGLSAAHDTFNAWLNSLRP